MLKLNCLKQMLSQRNSRDKINLQQTGIKSLGIKTGQGNRFKNNNK